jgi:hypothetical protein
MGELRCQRGRHRPTPVCAEAAQRAGWREHGILVAAQGPRFSWPEPELVRQLGTKLYGQRRAFPDA